MGKRIGYIVGCLLLAHVIASYICMWVVVMRLDELNQRFGAPKYVIPGSWRVQAPVRIWTVLKIIIRDDVDSTKGDVALCTAYVGPLLLLGGVLVTAPLWLFKEEKERSMYAGKKGR